MNKAEVNKNKKLLIVLTCLRAEGTPILVLEMCRLWITQGIQPTIMTLYPEPDDLLEDFKAVGANIQCINLPIRGYRRYFRLVIDFYRVCKQYRPHALLSMPLGWHAFIALGARLANVQKIAAHVGNFPPYWTGIAFRKFRWLVRFGRFFYQ